MMNLPEDINKYDLFCLVDFRVNNLADIVSLNGDLRLTYITHWLHFKQEIINLDNQYNLFNKEFWGYGINKISDGNELIENLDVSVVAKLPGHNKHHEHGVFNLIIFKIEGENFIYNIFSFNLNNLKSRMSLLKKVNLKYCQGIRLEKINQNLFISLDFETLTIPISFQLETYSRHNINSSILSNYYIQSISNAVNKISKKDVHLNSNDNNSKIDLIEANLRELILNTFASYPNGNDFKKIIPVSIQNNVNKRIQSFVRNHPNTSTDNFRDITNCLQFFDLMEYKDLISNGKYWDLFEKKFITKQLLEKHFGQLSNLRNTLRHSREMTELTLAEGNASIIWFNMALEK